MDRKGESGGCRARDVLARFAAELEGRRREAEAHRNSAPIPASESGAVSKRRLQTAHGGRAVRGPAHRLRAPPRKRIVAGDRAATDLRFGLPADWPGMGGYSRDGSQGAI